MKILPKPLTFEWDEGNIDKNLVKHNVTNKESEQVFLNEPNFIFKDEKHLTQEKRYMVWGVANIGRKLSVVFTMRGKKIRIISARDMNRKERRRYEEKVQIYTEV